MIVEPFGAWWCCLRTQERELLVLCSAAWFTNPIYIEESIFDAFTVVTGMSASIKMLAYFEAHYSLLRYDIPCGEDCVIHAVAFTDGFWPTLAVFIAENGVGCAKPCTILTFQL
jgi:hypothetical protein